MSDNDKNKVTHKKQARKKSLFEKIIDGIGFAFLLLFIVALIILHAPWELIAVLVAMLLVSIIVPKSSKKWIGRAFVIILAIFIVWVFLPDDNQNWRPFIFDKELIETETARSIPADQNAATIYNHLLENHDPNSFDKDFLSWRNKDLILSEFWHSEDYPEVASWLTENQQLVDQLMLAFKNNTCRFPIAGDVSTLKSKPPANFAEVQEFWEFLQEQRWSAMRHWGQLLIISANNNIANGQIDKALEKYIASLQLAKHLSQQPTDIDLLVAIVINLRAFEQINPFIVTGNATDEQLQLLDNSLQNIKYDWPSDIRQILDREKLMFKSFICAIFYQTNQDSKVRINRNPGAAVRTQFSYQLLSGESKLQPKNTDSYLELKALKAMSLFSWFFIPSDPHKTAEIIDDIYEKYYSMADPGYDWQKERVKYSLRSVRLNFRYFLEMMSSIMECAWSSIHDRYFQADTKLKGSQLMIALRDYKIKNERWPENLNELIAANPHDLFIDPINNDAFIYRLAEENFMLYSKGRNNIDEHCNLDTLTELKQCFKLRLSEDFAEDIADDIFIWPPEKDLYPEDEESNE